MPAIMQSYKNGILSLVATRESNTVTLKALVWLLGDKVQITVLTDDGHKLLTPYTLVMLGDREVSSMTITGEDHVIISLLQSQEEDTKHV